MSALDPVILGEVSKVSAAVAKLSAADSVLLDIPVRQGHSFSEGDIALYDTERGDLHDGRGEIIEYFSPPSGGPYYIAKTEQAPAVDLRQDGTILVAALFRSSTAEGTSSAYSATMSLEVGYRKPDGQFVYTRAASLPNSYLGYQIRDMRLIPISADEYFMVFFTNTSSNKYAHACSIRIVSGAPVIGAFTSSMDLGTSSYVPSFLLGVGSLYICIPGSTNPKTYRLVSSDGVITVSNPTVLLPAATGVYQIDASRILVMGSTPKLYRLAGSTPEVVDVTLDLSDFVNTPYYSPDSAFSIVKQGYTRGKDIVNGIFCPLDNGADRVYVSDTIIGGFTVDGTNVKVHPPYSDGGIGYDRIFYKGAIPTCAMHPVILASTANSYVLPASFFMKGGLFLAASSVSTIGAVSSRRTSVLSRYIDFGIVVARQSGKSAIAPIGAGGKVVARKYDQNLATKSAFFAIGVSGLLDVPEITTGRVRYPAATVTLTSPTSYDVNYMVPVVGPVNVQFLSLAPDAPSPGVKLWVCEDGVWSIKKVIKPAGGSLASIDASFAFKAATYFWDDVKLDAKFKLNIGIYDGVVK